MKKTRRLPRMLVISALLHASALAVGQWLMPPSESQPIVESDPLQILYVERARLTPPLIPTLEEPKPGPKSKAQSNPNSEVAEQSFEERAVLERAPRRILSAGMPAPGESALSAATHSLPVARSSMPSLPSRAGSPQAQGEGGSSRSLAALGESKVGSIAAGSPQGGVHGRLLLHQPMPRYPEASRKAGQEGEVRFSFRVKADGHLRPELRLLASSGDSALDQAAGLALRAYRFAPLPDLSKFSADQEGELSFVFRLRTQTVRSH